MKYLIFLLIIWVASCGSRYPLLVSYDKEHISLNDVFDVELRGMCKEQDIDTTGFRGDKTRGDISKIENFLQLDENDTVLFLRFENSYNTSIVIQHSSKKEILNIDLNDFEIKKIENKKRFNFLYRSKKDVCSENIVGGNYVVETMFFNKGGSVFSKNYWTSNYEYFLRFWDE